MADLGADVIKVEPAEGDLMRSRPVVRNGGSTMFGQLNAGKRSIVLNRAQFNFKSSARPMYGPIEASDGYVMLATAIERTFQDMASAAGRRDWLTDPRFEKYADRRMNWGLLIDELEQWSRTFTVKDIITVFRCKAGRMSWPLVKHASYPAGGRPWRG